MTPKNTRGIRVGTLPEGQMLFRVDEAAAILGLSPSYIRTLVARQTLLKLPRPGRIAIPRAQLENFLEERKANRPAQPRFSSRGRRCA